KTLSMLVVSQSMIYKLPQDPSVLKEYEQCMLREKELESKVNQSQEELKQCTIRQVKQIILYNETNLQSSRGSLPDNYVKPMEKCKAFLTQNQTWEDLILLTADIKQVLELEPEGETLLTYTDIFNKFFEKKDKNRARACVLV